MNCPPSDSLADLEAFIARWSGGDGGQERANYALFLSELCDVLGAPRPDQASHNAAANAYTFERAVTFREPDGATAAGRIDLYKRGCFVLEAKQSRRPGSAKAVPEQADLLAGEEVEATPRGKRTASRAWDVLMMSARRQAEDYAKALPISEGWPPFLIICDVGHCFEIFADFSGQGKNYAQFPDRRGFRIFLEDLRDEKIREQLRLIWLDPHKLDPTKIAAKATREVAERLAKVSKHLEALRDKDGRPLYDPEVVALFLMRCLFTMFAEDVELKRERDTTFQKSGVKDSGIYAQLWWLFAKPRQELRRAILSVVRYIATVQTAKHRVFQFLDANILPDIKLVAVASDDAFHLGILGSRIHLSWALRSGGWLGVGNDPVYAISRCFDPFPFPNAPEDQKVRIRAAAEELDALRKQVQAEHPELTLTQIYNVLEKLRAGEALNDAEETIKTKGLVLIVKELHDKIDALTAEAYGWPADLSDEEILQRLVALNAERAAEEKRGLIRWLRPDYQRARAGIISETPASAEEQFEAELVATETKAQKPSFPSGDVERTAAVFAALIGASSPLDAPAIAKSFKQGGKVEPAIARVLASLARLGHVHTNDGRSFALRRSA